MTLPSPANMDPLRILVLEDKATDAEILIREVKRAGFNPEWRRVETEAEFLEELAKDPDLILSDYSLPHFDGLRAVALVRKRDLDTPFILVSGTLGEEAAVEAMKFGVDDYLMKGRIVRLGLAIRRALEDKRLRDDRKQTEQALHTSAEKLRQIVEHSTQLYYSHTPEGVITYLSPRTREFLDCEPSEALTRWTDLLTDNPINAAGIAHTKQAIETGQPQPAHDLELRTTQGRIVLATVHESPVVEDGKTVAMVGALNDITESRRKEMQLRASEARHLRQRNALIAFTGREMPNEQNLEDTFRQLTEMDAAALDVARVSLWLYNADRTALRCVDLYDLATNHHSSGMELAETSYPAYFRALASSEVIAAEDAMTDPQTCEFAENYLQPLGITSMLDSRIHLGGDLKGVLCHEHTGPPRRWMTDEQSFAVAVANLAALALEATERKRAQEQVRLQISALEAVANAIVITNRDGVIEWVNPAFTTFTGYSATEAVGRDPGELLKSGTHDAAFYRAMWDTIIAGEVWRGEITNRRKDSHLYLEEMTITPLKDERGKILHFIAVKQDITERRKLEEQFRQSQKMEGIGQLASGVAHDFNNILAAIQMQAGLLKYGENLSPEDNELVDDIGEAVERAAALTRQLLMFSRKEVLREEDLDLNESIESMLKMLRRTIGEDIQMQLKLAAYPMLLHADPGMMDQVVLNLAVNARDAMPGGGQLVIETSSVEFDEHAASQSANIRAGSFVCLSVSDNGCGIPPEILSKIFEPFFTTKEVGKGTGLGLATVFGIVQQHRGWINAYSEVGQGTAFSIYLPCLAKLSGMKSPELVSTTLPGGKETILLVEDDPSLRIMLQISLSRLGYEVLDASDGIEALAVWEAHRDEIQLMLTDLVMPGGMNGIELGARLLKDNPKLKVIYASGYSAEVAGKVFPLKEGVNFLNKPFPPAKLAQTVRAMLDA